MHFTEFFAIIERDLDILNPISAEKLMLLASYCGIKDGQRVLDIGCGKGYLLRSWAQRWDIEGIGIDLNPTSIAEAQRKTQDEGLAGQLSFHCDDAKNYTSDEPFDVVCCIGASFALGDFQAATHWLSAQTTPTGVIALGDVFLPQPPPKTVQAETANIHSLAELEAIYRDASLFLSGIIAASQDDWDRYASHGWKAGFDWLKANPTHPDYKEVARLVTEGRALHLSMYRHHVGWAILVGQKQGGVI